MRKKKARKFVIRDLITHGYFFATEVIGPAIYYTKIKENSPQFDECKIFKVMERLRQKGAKIIHEPV